MKKILLIVFSGLICIHLAGCSGWALRTSSEHKLRVDQEISGNRGFIFGKPSSAPKEPAFTERKVYTVEIELPTLASAKPTSKKTDKELVGNRGYIFGGPAKEVVEEAPKTWEFGGEPVEEVKRGEEPQLAGPEPLTYTVRKGDTLQKISQQFYGTTKKWSLLYQANKDKLKSADKVYPGQVLIIPDLGQFKK